MMKFCYVDLRAGHGLDAEELLQRYIGLIDQLKERRPEIRIVHVTIPLRSDPPGWKTLIKRLLKRDTEEDADNVLRNAFNDKLRHRFAGEPIFDLAAVQSTRSDGRRSQFRKNGSAIATLASEYTSDGGHLNGEGQRRAAAEFLRVAATAIRRTR
jgi:hypothetical protein